MECIIQYDGKVYYLFEIDWEMALKLLSIYSQPPAPPSANSQQFAHGPRNPAGPPPRLGRGAISDHLLLIPPDPCGTSLYDDLRYNRLEKQVRLEQERVRFGWVKQYLEKAL